MLGSGEVLKGLELGLYDMCIGERRVLRVPPALAFGDRGSRAFGVPGGATLEYDVTLRGINLAEIICLELSICVEAYRATTRVSFRSPFAAPLPCRSSPGRHSAATLGRGKGGESKIEQMAASDDGRAG